MFVISSQGLCWTDAECGLESVKAPHLPMQPECFAHEPETCSEAMGAVNHSDCLGGKVCAEGMWRRGSAGVLSDENCETGFACFGEYVCPCGSTVFR